MMDDVVVYTVPQVYLYNSTTGSMRKEEKDGDAAVVEQDGGARKGGASPPHVSPSVPMLMLKLG